MESMTIYAEAMEQQFPFAIVTENFDESLLLMKRLYCWDLQDIIYIPLKVGFDK